MKDIKQNTQGGYFLASILEKNIDLLDDYDETYAIVWDQASGIGDCNTLLRILNKLVSLGWHCINIAAMNLSLGHRMYALIERTKIQCSKCGTLNNEPAKFCNVCGEHLIYGEEKRKGRQ